MSLSSLASPLVDVIIPAYNAARFLRPAIDSALAQEGVPLRVIVVDDGSTDDTAGIARSYGRALTLVSQENRGLPGARNSGIVVSTAPYIGLLDADDLWEPGKLARQIAVIKDLPPVGLVFTDMRIFEEDFKIVEDGFLLSTPAYARLDREALGDQTFLLPASLGQTVMRENFISPSTVLLRREAIGGVGGFDEAFRVCEDVECWIRILRTWRAAAIEQRLVRSRRWGGNISHHSDRMFRGRLQIAEKVFAQPELYPEGAVEFFRSERPIALMRLGRVAMENNDVRSARRHLLASFRARPRLSSALLFASTFVGPRARGALLRLKRAAGLRLPTRVE